jgi:YidC/Oxa1 family membrane protein insertase
MEKRLLLAAFLSVAVLLIWEALAPKPPARAPAPPGKPAAASPAAPGAAAATSSGPPAPAVEAPAPPPAAPALVGGEPIGASAAEVVTIDRPLYRARLSNRGGVLVSFVLKKYDDDRGQPLEMVHQEPGSAARPLSLDFGPDSAATRAANDSLYAVRRESRDGRETVTFRYRGDHREFDKTFVFDGGYLFSVRVRAEGVSEPFLLALGPGLRNLSPQELANRFTSASGAVYFDGSRARSLSRTKVEVAQTGALPESGFVGLEDNYFLAVEIPAGAASWKVVPLRIDRKDAQLLAGAVASRSLDTKVFVGPKDLDVLSGLKLHLEETVSFRVMGINLGVIAKPMIWLLKAAYHHVIPNWGMAILIVTFLIRLLLFPLMQKSYGGMKKMQKLQPKINAIKEKYKKGRSDPEQRTKMNQEMMALYSAEGYNPMSGCLPMLLQMPILFAFYVILEKAIELRHAPFYFWIKDLSAKDPTYVLVIVMTLTMFIQQLLTPSTAEPTQKRLFLIMPLFWGFFLKDMPAGLVLYWLFSNVLTIGQQVLINRMYREEPPAEPVRKRPKKARTGG